MTAKTKKKSAKKEEKYTLIELVASSEAHYPSVIMDLQQAGLLEQYYDELKANGRLDIEPSMTKAEFNKIIGE